jgi:hypothetical protein
LTERNVGLNERRKWSEVNERENKMNLGRMYSRMKGEEK